MIEAAIKTILVDLLIPELQQIAERRAPVPILGNVQLARWFTEPRRNQHGRHLRPSDLLSLPTGRSRSHRSSRPVPRHSASARYTSPN